MDKDRNPIYLQYDGPTQISRYGKELDNHGGNYHSEGFGSPLGHVSGFNKPLCDFNGDDIDSLSTQIESRIGFDSPFIIYCSDDDCGSSEDLAYELQDFGFTNILVFSGGWKLWTESGRKIQTYE